MCDVLRGTAEIVSLVVTAYGSRWTVGSQYFGLDVWEKFGKNRLVVGMD